MSTEIQDCGRFISFDQKICSNKQGKKTETVLHAVFKFALYTLQGYKRLDPSIFNENLMQNNDKFLGKP